MKKYVVILLGAAQFVACCCGAQEFDPITRPGPKVPAATPKKGKDRPVADAKPRKEAPSVIVLFNTSNDTCSIKIDERDYGQLTKDHPKLVRLSGGRYTLSFKSTRTGEVITPPDLYIDREMEQQGHYSYPPLRFRSNAPGAAQQPQAHPAGLTDSGYAKTPTPSPRGLPAEHLGDPSALSKEKATISELASDMVLVPGGRFSRGALDKEPYPVTIQALKFGKFEVTQLQWENIMGYNNSRHQGCVHCPIENVSFREVDSFIAKINRISRQAFRLPTEAEWAYVAQLGLEPETVSGGQKKLSRTFLDKTAWYINNSNGKTHPVGEKEPSAIGIYDLLGNVAEWCQEGDGTDSLTKDAVPPGRVASGEKKGIRGGAFDTYEADLRLQKREQEKPAAQRKTTGFRLVMELH